MTDPFLQETGSTIRPSRLGERRAAVVDAFMDLVFEGHVPPTTQQVADRAGVSMATFFRYFEKLDQLRQDAMVRAQERFSHLIQIPDLGTGPRDERIREFAGIRVKLHERTHALARLLRSTALQDPGAAKMIRFTRTAMAEQVRRHFDPELRELSVAEREDAVAAIATLTSVESWEQFRHAYGRSPTQTRRAWARTIDRILNGD